MFDIDFNDQGVVVMKGRLDAAQAQKAQDFLGRVAGECVVDMTELDYISSAGLGVLLKAHKRLMAVSSGLKLINVNHYVNDIFRYSGFDKLFDIKTL